MQNSITIGNGCEISPYVLIYDHDHDVLVDGGLHANMFDTNAVQYYANERGFYELVNYLIDHKKEYTHFIMTRE